MCNIIIKDVHLAIGHAGQRKTYKKISENYANIPRKLVASFIQNCECRIEKCRKKEITAVIKPIITEDFNERAQVDLVNFQSLPDGEFE